MDAADPRGAGLAARPGAATLRRARSAALFAAVTAVAALLLATCGDADAPREASATPAALSGIRYLAGDETTAGFARALAPRPFAFPADYGSHPRYRTEWWYFTGNLFDERNRHYGFELTLFRIALGNAPDESVGDAVGNSPTARDRSLASTQAWMAHLTVTDTEAATFTAAERLSRDAAGISGATWLPAADRESPNRTDPSTAPDVESSAPGDNPRAALELRVEDWSIAIRDDTAYLSAADDGFGIDLTLDGFDRIVVQGDRGLDAKGPEPGNASFYYSAPRLSVTGQVHTNGAAPVAVRGTAWMDREWSTSALSADLAGWDWFALQLDDGRDLMFYRLRGRDGSTSAFSGGTIADASGTITRLDADAVELSATREWRSPVTGVRYPVAWRMRIPQQDLSLAVEPRLDDQELDLSVRYWEGAVSVTGTAAGRRLGGVGYLELAGY